MGSGALKALVITSSATQSSATQYNMGSHQSSGGVHANARTNKTKFKQSNGSTIPNPQFSNPNSLTPAFEPV